MISEGTKNQLMYTERFQKQIGIRRDYRSSISEGEFPVFIKYTGNEDYWDEQSEIVINQSEFNSVGLNFMHFKDPSLSYDKLPYKVSKVWVDIGGENKTPMIGVQQVYYDTIKCKLIGTPDQIEGVRLNKRFEEEKSWQDELAEIRAYSTNEWFRGKEQIQTLKSGERTVVTTIDDYDIEYSISTNWKTFKQGLLQSKRVAYLEEQLEKIERITNDMSKTEKRIYQILAEEYGVDIFDIDERYMLAEKKTPYDKSIAEKIAHRFDTHPAEVWKAYWVYIEPWVRRELDWLEIIL